MPRLNIPVVLFYSNDHVSLEYLFFKVCVGFVGWFLSALLLLKIIFNMKKCYVGNIENV